MIILTAPFTSESPTRKGNSIYGAKYQNGTVQLWKMLAMELIHKDNLCALTWLHQIANSISLPAKEGMVIVCQNLQILHKCFVMDTINCDTEADLYNQLLFYFKFLMYILTVFLMLFRATCDCDESARVQGAFIKNAAVASLENTQLRQNAK